MNPQVNPRLLCISGPLRDSTFVLPSGEVPIGRDPGNLLAISDAALSRKHCLLRPNGSGYLVRDLESRNGTYVGGVRVTLRASSAHASTNQPGEVEMLSGVPPCDGGCSEGWWPRPVLPCP